jgi:hypothetical protein
MLNHATAQIFVCLDPVDIVCPLNEVRSSRVH